MITLALPKGRLYEKTRDLLARCGYHLTLSDRQLVAEEPTGRIRAILVKNSDLPTYVHNGIAGIGVCGTDVIFESGYPFHELLTLPYGQTRICLAGLPDAPERARGTVLEVATKFPRFTRSFFHAQGIPVSVVKLNGSVELAPVLGLTPYIVDLVETGSTLKAHNLEIHETIGTTTVKMIANYAFYKYHYRRVDDFVKQLQNHREGTTE